MAFRIYWEEGTGWQTYTKAIDFAHSHVALVGNQAEGTLVQPRLRRGARADEHRHSTTFFSKKSNCLHSFKIYATTSMNRKKTLALNGVRSSPNISALFTVWDCLQHSELFFSVYFPQFGFPI